MQFLKRRLLREDTVPDGQCPRCYVASLPTSLRASANSDHSNPLIMCWNDLQQAGAKKAGRKLLSSLVNAIIDECNGYRSEFEPPLIGVEYPERHGDVSGEGHRADLVIEIIEAFASASASFMADFPSKTRDPDRMPYLIGLIKSLVLLARYPHNRIVLQHHEAAHTMLNFARYLSDVVTKPASSATSTSATAAQKASSSANLLQNDSASVFNSNPSADSTEDDLVVIIFCAMRFVVNLLDPSQSFRKSLLCVGASEAMFKLRQVERKATNPALLLTTASNATATSAIDRPSDAPLRSQALEVLTHLLKSVQRGRSDIALSPNLRLMQDEAIFAIGSILSGGAASVNVMSERAREFGTLEAVMGVIGWKQFLRVSSFGQLASNLSSAVFDDSYTEGTKNDVIAGDDGESVPLTQPSMTSKRNVPLNVCLTSSADIASLLRKEFFSQLLAFHVLMRAIESSNVSLERLHQSGGTVQLCDFFLWVIRHAESMPPSLGPSTYASISPTLVCHSLVSGENNLNSRTSSNAQSQSSNATSITSTPTIVTPSSTQPSVPIVFPHPPIAALSLLSGAATVSVGAQALRRIEEPDTALRIDISKNLGVCELPGTVEGDAVPVRLQLPEAEGKPLVNSTKVGTVELDMLFRSIGDMIVRAFSLQPSQPVSGMDQSSQPNQLVSMLFGILFDVFDESVRSSKDNDNARLHMMSDSRGQLFCQALLDALLQSKNVVDNSRAVYAELQRAHWVETLLCNTFGGNGLDISLGLRLKCAAEDLSAPAAKGGDAQSMSRTAAWLRQYEIGSESSVEEFTGVLEEPVVNSALSHANDNLQQIRLNSLHLIVRAAANQNLEATPSVSLLLQSLALHAQRPVVLCMVAERLLYLQQLRPVATKDAMLKLKCLNVLLPIARDCYSPEQARARSYILSLIGIYVIDNPAGVHDVFTSNQALKLLMSFLQDVNTPPEVWRWALRVLVHIVRTVSLASSSRMVTLLNMFLKVFVSNSEGFVVSVRLSMLRSIREMLAGETRARLQQAFIDAGCFIKIVNVIVDNQGSSSPGLEMCTEVVRTLTALMAGSSRCLEKFRAHVGFPHLGRCLLLAVNNVVNRELLMLLLDMCVDGEYSLDRITANVVCKTDALLLALDMYHRLSSENRVWLAEQIGTLCKESYGNCTRCCGAGVLSKCLGLLPSVAVDDVPAYHAVLSLVELLGAHSISAAELKQLCRLFRLSADFRRPSEAPRLLQSIQRMCLREGPSLFFDFPRETKTGIYVPPSEKRPGSGYGITFFTWVRFESFGEAVQKKKISMPDPTAEPPSKKRPKLIAGSDQPQLFTISSTGKERLTARLTHQGQMQLQVLLNGVPHELTFTEYTFKCARWYMVTIVHSSARRPFVKAEARLYVDGKHIQRANFVHPSLSGAIDECFLASGLCGQMGATYLMSESLSTQQIEDIHSLGPQYMGQFQAPDINSLPVSAASLFDGSLTGKIWLNYNAKACKGRICLDLAFRPAKSILLDATLHGHQCVTTSIKDVFRSVGGVELLFILIPQVDFPEYQGLCHEVTAAQQIGEAVDALANTSLNLTISEDQPKDLLDKTMGEDSGLDLIAEHTEAPDMHSVPETPMPSKALPPFFPSSPRGAAMSIVESTTVNALQSPNRGDGGESNAELMNALMLSRPTGTSSVFLNALTMSSTPAVCTRESLLITQLFTTIRELVAGYPENEQRVNNCQGISTIAWMLQRVRTPCVTVETLRAIHELYDNVEDARLQADVAKYLLLDFRLWERCDFTTQITHLQFVAAVLKSEPEMMRLLYGTQFWLDVLAMHHWYEMDVSTARKMSLSIVPATAGAAPVSSNVRLGAVSDRRWPLSEDERRTVRGIILEIMRQIFDLAVRPADVEAVVSFLCTCKDMEQIHEILRFCNDACSFPGFAELFAQNGGGEACAALLSCKLERVRALALRMQLLYLTGNGNVPDKMRKRFRLDELAEAGALRRLGLYPISLKLTRTLFDLCAEGKRDGVLRQSHILSALFYLLKPADPTIRTRAALRVRDMLRESVESRQVLRDVAAWSSYLLDWISDQLHHTLPPTQLLAEWTTACTPMSGLPESPSANTSRDQFSDLAEDDTVASVHVQGETMSRQNSIISHRQTVVAVLDCIHEGVRGAMYVEKKAWKVAEDCMRQADLLFPGEHQRVIREWSQRGILGRALTQCLREVKDCKDPNKPPPLLATTALHLILLTEEFVFFTLKSPLLRTLDHGAEPVDDGGRGSPPDSPPIESPVTPSPIRHASEYDDSSFFLGGALGGGGGADGDDRARIESFIRPFEPTGFFDETNQPIMEWPDAAICVAMIRLTDAMNRTFSTTFAGLDSAAGGRSHIHSENGGVGRISMRCLTALLRCRDPTLCRFALDRLQSHLCSPNQTAQRTCWALSYMDVAIQMSLARPGCTNHRMITQSFQLILRTSPALVTFVKQVPILESSLLEELDALIARVQTQEWRDMVTLQLEPMVDKIERADNQAHANHISKRLVRRMQKAHSLANRKIQLGSLADRRLEDYVLAAVQQRALVEQTRLGNVQRQKDVELRMLQAQWEEYVSFMLGERGAFAMPNPVRGGWVLDPTETSSRMRRKLAPTPFFNSHREASIARDSGRAATGEAKELSIAGIVSKVARKQAVRGDRFEELNPADGAWEDDHVDAMHHGAADVMEVVHTCDCELVTLMSIVPGRLEISTMGVRFTADREGSGRDEGSMVIPVDRRVWDFRWDLSDIREMHLRRHMLRRSALEIFLVDQTNCFLNFTKAERNVVYSKLLSLRPPNMIYADTRSPAELLRKTGLTQKWQKREISNFDYLMQLNTIAGRTYNDLNQYPVFPWVIADYESAKLDLNNPKTYRDLSKPVGALNPKRLEYFKERYETFEDGTIEKFHYGSHYSTAVAVLYFLVRMEPFTTLHIRLQGGRFDHADRQFSSVASCWNSCMTSTTDVKELVPEFFYCPEFLQNLNDLDLGSHQASVDPVDHVVLPPWASSPEEFIRQNRAALESEYVSAHLHEWVDLIFGYKQTGKDAEENFNVFYYVTYEGAIDIDSITDPIERKAIEAQINNFGQTPCQLLNKPHPRRNMPAVEPRDLAPFLPSGITGINYRPTMGPSAAVASTPFGTSSQSKSGPVSISAFQMPELIKAYALEVYTVRKEPIVFISIPESQLHSFMYSGSPDRVVTISESGMIGFHSWFPTAISAGVTPFTFDLDPGLASGVAKLIGGPFAQDISISPSLFVSSDDGKLAISGGHWDSSIKLTSFEQGRVVQSVFMHTDVVTCVALDEQSGTLVSGSRDTTCMLWRVQYHNDLIHRILPTPIHVLYGHDDEVLCVALNSNLDIVVSGAKDGTLIVHTIRLGRYVRTIRPPFPANCAAPPHVRFITICNDGSLLVYTERLSYEEKGSYVLYLYSINGKLIAQSSCNERVLSLCVNSVSTHFVVGYSDGTVEFRRVFDLGSVHSMNVHLAIYSIALTSGDHHVVLGLRDGRLIIMTSIPSPYSIKL